MGLKGTIAHNFLKGSCEIQRVWVEVTLLGFLKEVLDPDVHNVEESGYKELVILL